MAYFNLYDRLQLVPKLIQKWTNLQSNGGFRIQNKGWYNYYMLQPIITVIKHIKYSYMTCQSTKKQLKQKHSYNNINNKRIQDIIQANTLPTLHIPIQFSPFSSDDRPKPDKTGQKQNRFFRTQLKNWKDIFGYYWKFYIFCILIPIYCLLKCAASLLKSFRGSVQPSSFCLLILRQYCYQKVYSQNQKNTVQMNSKSLLASIHKNVQFRIHFSRDGQLFTVTLTNEDLTIKDAILRSVEKFNLQYQLDFTPDSSLYQLYGARKSGKKKDDLPSFDKSQMLGQTCLRNFYLMPIYFSPKLNSKDSGKSIQTQITLDSRSKNEILQNPTFGCFCIRKGSAK